MEHSAAFVCQTCQAYLSGNTSVKNDSSDDNLHSNASVCAVCLGLWQDDSSESGIQKALEEACRPYGGLTANHFASLTNHGPTISICGEIYARYQWAANDHKRTSSISSKPFSVYIHDLKQKLYNRIQTLTQTSQNQEATILSNEEQQGYLSVHMLCIPPKIFHTEDPNLSLPRKKAKRQRQRPFTTQGGDPRVNLEAKLKEEGYFWLSQRDAEELPLTEPVETPNAVKYFVAVFRRPIYIYGYYTKARRDVSQTPFVIDGKTLGVTSVEEQVCGPIIKELGVSSENNLPNSNVQYGMCKFHASGREDMDVRMLLKPDSDMKGRPFCVQVVDALRPLKSIQQLESIVAQVNQGDCEGSPLWHGTNPMGVGIAPDIQLVPAQSYSNLQADTETKVKHYGCHCWSEMKLPENWQWPTSSTSFPLKIQQKTPLRVLHRRANLVRDRLILEASATRLDDHHYHLKLRTQAGTYVKEFVHGDLKRTTPSVASLLGCKTNLLLLDCEGIEMNSMEEEDK